MHLSTALFTVAYIAVPFLTSAVVGAPSGLRTALTTTGVVTSASTLDGPLGKKKNNDDGGNGDVLEVFFDYNADHAITYGPMEIALVEEAMILACNQAYDETDLHCTTARLKKVTQTPHQVFFPTDFAVAEGEDNFDVIDTEDQNMEGEDVVDELSWRKKKRKSSNSNNNNKNNSNNNNKRPSQQWYAGSGRVEVNSRCRNCKEDDDDRLSSSYLEGKSKNRKDMEDIFLELVHNDSQFASLTDLKIFIEYNGHDIDDTDDMLDASYSSVSYSSGMKTSEINIEVSFKTDKNVDITGPKMDLITKSLVSAVNDVYDEDELHLDDAHVEQVEQEPATGTTLLFGEDGTVTPAVESGNDWWKTYMDILSNGSCRNCNPDDFLQVYYLIGNGPYRKEFESKFREYIQDGDKDGDFANLSDLKISFKVKGKEIPVLDM